MIFEVPRKLILFFAASQLHTNTELKLVEFLKEFGFVASAFRKHHQGPDSDAKVFFCDLELKQIQGVFQLLKVQALPHVRVGRIVRMDPPVIAYTSRRFGFMVMVWNCRFSGLVADDIFVYRHGLLVSTSVVLLICVYEELSEFMYLQASWCLTDDKLSAQSGLRTAKRGLIPPGLTLMSLVITSV